MYRSPGSDHPAHRRARPATMVGAFLAVLTLIACGSPSAEPSASPTDSVPVGPSPSSPPATSASASPVAPQPSSARPTHPTPDPATTSARPTPSATPATPTREPSEPEASTTPAPVTTAPRPTPTATRSPTPTPTPSPTATPDLVGLWAGQDIEAFATTRRVVALTFDGGASADAVPQILATLRSAGVPATFFVTGDFARRYPAEVRAIAAAGYPVGNHSDTHPYFSRITDDQIRTELVAADRSITALTGRATAPVFRFPFGDRTPYDIGVVNDNGYIPIRWTVDTLGWKGTSGGITAAIVRQRVLDALRPGEIVLMHVGANPDDGSTLDADALPAIIRALRDRGYGFATIPDLLDDPR